MTSTYDPIARRSVVFARQPGTFAVVFDHAGRTPPVTIQQRRPAGTSSAMASSRPTAALLYATENDFDNAAGMIGVYDATGGFARIGEFPTHGIGPARNAAARRRRTLAVANGGIETHPDFGRAKLNYPTMKPSFVFVDRVTGDLIEKHELPPELHQLSIRHMDIDVTGAVWFGCQHEGPATERPPLVGRARARQGA